MDTDTTIDTPAHTYVITAYDIPKPTRTYALAIGDILADGTRILSCYSGVKTPKDKKDVTSVRAGKTVRSMWHKNTVVSVVGHAKRVTQT